MNKRTIAGSLLVLLGAWFLLAPGSGFGPGRIIAYFWPSMFIIPLGIFFHWLYYYLNNPKAVGVLVPGGILLTIGVVCQISMLTGGWAYMWPGFIMAPAIGLLELYWLGGRNRWLLIPINILLFLSLLFFIAFTVGSLFSIQVFGQPFIVVALILIGGALLVLTPRRDK